MRIVVKSNGQAEMILTRKEWEEYGQSMGWGISKVASTGTPETLPIKIVKSDTGHRAVISYDAWRDIGKKAEFYEWEDDDEYDTYDLAGDQDIDMEDDEEGEEDYLHMLDDVDVEEDATAEEDAVEEAVDMTVEALGTAIIGITDGSVPKHNIPYMILSALEPISEFRNIDMAGDPTEAISLYLSSEPANDSEMEIMKMIEDAYRSAGMEVGENVI